jgi:hypothetical protein
VVPSIVKFLYQQTKKGPIREVHFQKYCHDFDQMGCLPTCDSFTEAQMRSVSRTIKKSRSQKDTKET